MQFLPEHLIDSGNQSRGLVSWPLKAATLWKQNHYLHLILLLKMAIVTSGKVLVTGANGFIAIWVVNHLLEQGYAVRATVRSADKGVHLAKTFAAHGDKLEITVIEDITVVSCNIYIL